MRLLGRGEFFGVFETLDALFGQPTEVPPWGVTSGARSVLVLASQMSGRTVRWLTTSLAEPGNPTRQALPAIVRSIQQDGWEYVRHMVGGKLQEGTREWTTEVLVLPGATRPRLRSDPSATESLLAIAEVGWCQSRPLRGHLLDEENLVLNDYLAPRKIHRDERISMLGVLRQILAMARGELPAFAPANSETVLPLRLFRERLLQSPDHRAAIVIVPQHLKDPGDVAFVSVKFNFLPAQGSDEPKTFINYCDDVEGALHHISGHSLDLSKTRFLSAKDALDELAKLSGVSAGEVSSRHPFLTGCLKLVRGGRGE